MINDARNEIASLINKFVNHGIYYSVGFIRNIPFTISGTTSTLPMLIESIVSEDIENILSRDEDEIDVAIELALYVMKKQLFTAGNKRTGIIYANQYLISKEKGLLLVPYEEVLEFQKELMFL